LHDGKRGPRLIPGAPLYLGGSAVYIGGEVGSASSEKHILMLDDIYNRRVLELAADIPRLGRLAAPDASARAHSRLCGSTVTVDLCLRDGRVSDFAHDVRACALGQASSSLMARGIVGATPEELVELRATMLAMLKAGGPPPQGKWADFAALEPVRDFKARHASTMLTFDAVVDALGQIAAAEGARTPASATA
jgi:NifU-like protein involved in Fe-S cluster formation